jgi:hypothetical protein
MKQQTLAVAADQNVQYEQYRRPTKRDTFLATMEKIVPWAELCAVIEPHYPKAGNRTAAAWQPGPDPAQTFWKQHGFEAIGAVDAQHLLMERAPPLRRSANATLLKRLTSASGR